MGRSIDAEAIHAHLRGAPFSNRTLFGGIAQLAPGQSLSRSTHGAAQVAALREIASVAASSDLETLLTHAIEETLAQTKRVALALSGGLDSALVLTSAFQSLGATHVTAYVLDAALTDYSERDTAYAPRRQWCMPTLRVVQVHEADFVDALSDTTAVVEEPLYNAHPVAKFLLARAMRRDGVEVALSGDGADQVMKRDTRADYLPLAHALFAANHVTLRSPFNAHVVAHLCALPAGIRTRLYFGHSARNSACRARSSPIKR